MNLLIMNGINCFACPGLWDSIRINCDQLQLCAVKALQIWQECFPKHDINIHETENNGLQPSTI